MSTGVARLQAAFLHPDNTCSTPSTIIVSQTRISSALLGCLSLPSKQSESLTVHLRSPDTVLGMKDLKTETTASLNFTADGVVFLSQCTLRSHLTLLSVFWGGLSWFLQLKHPPPSQACSLALFQTGKMPPECWEGGGNLFWRGTK